MKSHARRGNGARPRDPRSPRRFSCGGFVTELLLSLSLSLLLPLFPSPYFFAPTTRPRFERNVHEQVHAIYRAFLLPPSLASRRAILFNFVEAAQVVKRLQRVNVVSLSWCVAFTSETFIMLVVVVSSRRDDYIKINLFKGVNSFPLLC